MTQYTGQGGGPGTAPLDFDAEMNKLCETLDYSFIDLPELIDTEPPVDDAIPQPPQPPAQLDFWHTLGAQPQSPPMQYPFLYPASPKMTQGPNVNENTEGGDAMQS
eukprot:comp16136_c0_seq1/m.13714 comp16136_c0_seq1/g.13714  ORF comp16136_c0_seq1/g.13714 comp16136_c0_seq1/m.13714 type:complete len:106 (-) comp16136_c0_seq1:222-539(-)